MDLVMHSYYDTDADVVAAELDAAIDTGLDAAARRLRTGRTASAAARDNRSVRVQGGLPELDGSSVAVAQRPGLVEVQIRVPWSATPDRERRTLAAAAFSGAVTERLREAAKHN